MRISKVILMLSLMIFLSGCGTVKPLSTQEESKYTVTYFLMANQKSPDFDKKLVPAGSLILSCGEYLTVRNEPSMVYSDRSSALRSSLERLLSLQLTEDNFYTNNISAQNTLRLTEIDVDGNEATVKLDGELRTTENNCYDGAMKIMIEQTANQFGYKINILLNNSSEEWKCLFSTEPICQK